MIKRGLPPRHIFGLAATTSPRLWWMLIPSPMQETDTPSQLSQNHERLFGRLSRQDSLRLLACSICLRVRMDREWVEAREVIRTLRTFEHESIVCMRSGLCDRCEEGLRLRRQRDPEQLAA
jgi:hypothetical protein